MQAATPTHRETIVDLDMMLGIIADPTLILRVKQGLTGVEDRPRYGLPFAGDNNYLFDRIDCLEEPIPSYDDRCHYQRELTNLLLRYRKVLRTLKINFEIKFQLISY